MTPVVSVICVCYNHARFVAEAIDSVRSQTHTLTELIVIDDHSEDSSWSVIESKAKEFSFVHYRMPTRSGNCAAFNEGLRRSRGSFVIDLSADDKLFPERIEKGLASFDQHGADMGVHFSDAILIDVDGNTIGSHSKRVPFDIPQGNLYADLISRYFICSPTMMMRREVLDDLGGYDESLSYEDFDFWIRSSRKFNYFYSPEPLVWRRVVPGSLGSVQRAGKGNHWKSTLRVLEKAFVLNRTEREHSLTRDRVMYECMQSVVQFRLDAAWAFLGCWWRHRRVSSPVARLT